MKAYEEFQPQGVVFIGLTAEEEDVLDRTKAFLEDCGIEYVNGYGAGETLTELGVQALPTKIVIGRDGRIAWHSFAGGSLEQALTAALAASPSS